jgi:hypothetical protein
MSADPVEFARVRSLGVITIRDSPIAVRNQITGPTENQTREPLVDYV